MSRPEIEHGLIPEIRYDDKMEPIISYRPNLRGRAFTPRSEGNVLILRWGGIGDLVMLSPSLRAMKQKYPNLSITLASKWPMVLNGMPYLKASIPIEQAVTKDYDSVIDLRMMVESAGTGGLLPDTLYKSVNRMEMFGRLLGIEIEDFSADAYVDPSRIQRLRSMIGHADGIIGIQATCTSNLRTIPPDYLPGLIELLGSTGKTKVVLFGKLEYWHGRRLKVDLKNLGGGDIINLVDRLDIQDLVPLVSLCDLVIAPDSSAIHIAGALNIPCLALFGNIHPYLRTHHYRSVTNLYPDGELDCIPCYDLINPCLFYRDIPTVEQPVGAECMRKLTAQRIFEKVKEILKA